jgi:predicted nucleic acid-binding protein
MSLQEVLKLAIIAATALHLGVPVISRDSKIKLSTVNNIW